MHTPSSCIDRAIAKVRECADILEKEANRIGILRSVEATEASSWLDHVAEQMRAACEEPPKGTDDDTTIRLRKGPVGGNDHKVERGAARKKAAARPGPVR